MKAVFLFQIILICSVFQATSQEVFIYLTGRTYYSGIPIDTIILRNLTQPGVAVLAGLPQSVTTYKLDLMHGNLIYSVPDDHKSFGISVLLNKPGQLRLSVNLMANEIVQSGLYTTDGKLISCKDLSLNQGANLIDVVPGMGSLCLFKIKTRDHSAVFKCCGIPGSSQPSAINNVSGQAKSGSFSAEIFKSIPFTLAFNPGDAIQFTLIKQGYYKNSISALPQNQDSLFVYLSKPCANATTVTDYDGNTYGTVMINGLCWMRENLKTTHFADGTPLVDGTGAGNINYDYTPYWFDYEDTPSNSATYGRLYSGAAAMRDANGATGNIRGVCPSGWHLSSDTEWCSMEMFLDNTITYCGPSLHDPFGTTIGNSLKETDTLHWYGNPGVTSNISGFTALPGGNRSGTAFGGLGYWGLWWVWEPGVATGASLPQKRRLLGNDPRIYREISLYGMGFSVRCVKDY